MRKSFNSGKIEDLFSNNWLCFTGQVTLILEQKGKCYFTIFCVQNCYPLSTLVGEKMNSLCCLFFEELKRALIANEPREILRYDMLFEEDREGNQGPFIECVR